MREWVKEKVGSTNRRVLKFLMSVSKNLLFGLHQMEPQEVWKRKHFVLEE
jgi:hypothetical protein